MTKLSDIEWTTCWMAIRYAMNRQTIASATLPQDLVKAYGKRWTNNQMLQLYRELLVNEEDVKRMTDGKQLAFGHPDIDRPHWLKFMGFLNTDGYIKHKLVDGTECVTFEANKRIYPLEKYVTQPYNEIFLPLENIKKEACNTA